MKRTLRLPVAALLAFLATGASAANVWQNDMPVLSIMSLPDGGFILTGPANTAPACGGNGSQFYVKDAQNSQTPNGVKAALATSLAAFALGAPVTLLYDNANATCYVQIVQMNS